MKTIQIFDNIISKSEQDKFENHLYSLDFPWFYVRDIALKDNQTQKRPGFTHSFQKFGKVNSEGFDFIKKISQSVNKKLKNDLKEYHTRSFLQLPLNENYLFKNSKTKHLEDTPHLDLWIPHTVYLYYINDCDGDTIIYDYKSKHKDDIPNYEQIKVLKKVTPKKGRVVVFDGMYWHSSSQPTIGPRCIINFDMIDENNNI